MKKAVEAAIVISISVMTISTTATYIHDQAQQRHVALAQAARTQLAKAAKPAAQQAPTPATSRSTTSSVPTSAPALSLSDSGVVQNWSSQDTQRFLAITDKLVHSLTAQDWRKIEQTLSQGNERQAQIALMTIAHKYLTTSDETWVATHLAGNKPFGPVDVALLQQAFKELEGQLTPTEQQLLQENHLL